MSTTNFIPEIWSASVLENFHENTMLTSLANREYETDLVQGYKVHIPGIVDVQVKDYKTGVTGARTTKADHPVAIAYYAPVVAYVSQLQQMEAMRAEDFLRTASAVCTYTAPEKSKPALESETQEETEAEPSQPAKHGHTNQGK